MSLPLPALLAALANAQANEVAPALQMLGQPGAPDSNYAGGTATTSALMLMLAAAEMTAQPGREAAMAGAARAMLGDAAGGRDARAAALGHRAAAGDAAALALLAAEAQACWQAIAAPLGLPLPVAVD